jgi:hypothetical protein
MDGSIFPQYSGISSHSKGAQIDELNRTRLVARGDRVHYPGNAGTPTANLLTIKLLINSTIFTMGAKFMTMDIKDFYLKHLKLSDILSNMIKHYNLNKIATPGGYVYCKTPKGM